MAKYVIRVTNSLQLLQLTKIVRGKSGGGNGTILNAPRFRKRVNSCNIFSAPYHGRAASSFTVPNCRIYRRVPLENQPRICIYNARITPEVTILCDGALNHRIAYYDTKSEPSISMYIGTPHGFYFLRRRARWLNHKLALGPATTHFLTALVGPAVNKVVYNDAVDLACFIKYNLDLDLCNVLDLSYMYTTQCNARFTTTSLAMLRELQNIKSVKQYGIINRTSTRRFVRSHSLAIRHLSLANDLLEYLLQKQGHPENSWKERIQYMIRSFTSQPTRRFHMQAALGVVGPGKLTPSAFKGHLEATIERVIGKRTTVLDISDEEVIAGIVKSKSFVEQTALLITNVFVLSNLHDTVKPLYAMVPPESFNQFADIQAGDAVDIVPARNEKGVVELFNFYDKFCCKVERQHGNTLFYDVRTKRLVPKFTPRH
ncbi:uncharacterized protein BXIN_1003 [Babesia sp. Xinjiang]|uniref:uncharacterized protein n=1 Tax=Babesia sp. Xinjiang TaxID=462227 RepID=UPI000A24B1B5|nr:uncharacterized protein BXIN_1003 [Babesia sp. Xinjiang]ORM42218.1 hypothetical protein BXIN_1003 [Babesia sp. Xinjiang]